MSDETPGQLVEVADNPDQDRYEVRIGGELAGIAQYRPRPGALAFVHTEIYDRFEGRGLGGKLVSFALADARARRLAVLPFCPFVKGYVERHPEYLDLIPEERRPEFGLG